MAPTNSTNTKPMIYISVEDSRRLSDLAETIFSSNPNVSVELLEEVDRAIVLPQGSIPAGVVTMNSEVEYLDEHTGRRHRVRLVYPKDADIEAGRISVLTPIGAALIGLSKGQKISWNTRSGERRTLSVVAVEPAYVHA